MRHTVLFTNSRIPSEIQSDTQSECCTIVSKYNLVPFVSWGTTPTSKQSWWDANMCNDLVGGCSRSRCSGARGIGVLHVIHGISGTHTHAIWAYVAMHGCAAVRVRPQAVCCNLVGVTKEASCSSTAGKACAGQMCFKDPSCKNGGLGCNAAGMGECRFCGFGAYAGIECPGEACEIKVRGGDR